MYKLDKQTKRNGYYEIMIALFIVTGALLAYDIYMMGVGLTMQWVMYTLLGMK